MQIIHITELQSFRRCRQQWYFKNVAKLEPIRKSYGATWFGTLMHKVLADYYAKGIDPIKNFERLWQADIVELTLLPESIIERTLELHPIGLSMLEILLDRKYKWDVVAVEQPLKTALVGAHGQIELVGTIDLVVDEGSQRYIVDHKTYKSFVTSEDLEIDEQMTGYIYLWKEATDELVPAMYNQMRKKVPAEPKPLQRGGLSKAQGIDTTYKKYMDAIIDLRLDPEDYRDVLHSLMDDARFIQRTYAYRTPLQLRGFEQRVIAQAEDMAGCHIYPNFSRDCKGCHFYDLCTTKYTGGDITGVMETLYRTVEAPQYGTKMEED